MKKFAIIVAGGSGTRMGTTVPKQFLPLHGKPVLWHTVNAFTSAYSDIIIILVLPAMYMAEGEAIAKEFPSYTINVTAGGDTRFQSVKNGLVFVENGSVVFVHDGVRCLITKDLIHRCYHATITDGNAIAAIPATDTVRIKTHDGTIQLNRDNVYMIQTPQTFRSDILKKAFEQDYRAAFTDEASVVEALGEKVSLVEGENTNIKITRPVDLIVAERILQERKDSL